MNTNETHKTPLTLVAAVIMFLALASWVSGTQCLQISQKALPLAPYLYAEFLQVANAMMILALVLALISIALFAIAIIGLLSDSKKPKDPFTGL